MFNRIVLALGIGVLAALALAATAGHSHAATARLFLENFEGYTAFAPLAKTFNGVPAETVQNYGSINRPDDANANDTSVGRFDDEAGRVFQVSTLGLTNVNHSFAWHPYGMDARDFGKRDDLLFTESCLAAVPEPSSVLLILLGLLALGAYRGYARLRA